MLVILYEIVIAVAAPSQICQGEIKHMLTLTFGQYVFSYLLKTFED